MARVKFKAARSGSRLFEAVSGLLPTSMGGPLTFI
jgi:hypothetical protein